MIPLSQIFFLGIVFYLIYRFVFNFLIPIFKTTRHVRAQFKNMQDHMQQGQPFQQPGGNPFQPNSNPFQQQYARPQEPAEPAPPSNNSMGEYIDFEEVKGK